MRYSPEHKQQTRERIISAAARHLRERGFAGTGVAAVMREADLTHGGFYAHFESKDDLIVEVIRHGLADAADAMEARFDHLEGDDWLEAWAHAYLSPEHADHVADGCPFPALAADVARAGDRPRAVFTELFAARLAHLADRIDAPRAEAERRALAAVAQMIGALLLSRALDEPLATDIRAAAASAAAATLTSERTPHDAETEGTP